VDTGSRSRERTSGGDVVELEDVDDAIAMLLADDDGASLLLVFLASFIAAFSLVIFEIVTCAAPCDNLEGIPSKPLLAEETVPEEAALLPPPPTSVAWAEYAMEDKSSG
jgi:hypothetical protein